jgi:hypothetical protein
VRDEGENCVRHRRCRYFAQIGIVDEAEHLSLAFGREIGRVFPLEFVLDLLAHGEAIRFSA